MAADPHRRRRLRWPVALLIAVLSLLWGALEWGVFLAVNGVWARATALLSFAGADVVIDSVLLWVVAARLRPRAG